MGFDPSDTGAVLYQLSYQAIWELVIFYECATEPVDDMVKEQCIKDIHLKFGNSRSSLKFSGLFLANGTLGVMPNEFAKQKGL